MLRKLEIILQNEIDPAFSKRAGFIFEEFEKVRPKKILDVGCGRGFYLNALALYDFVKEIHGIDLNGNYVKKAKCISRDNRIKIKQASVYKLPYSDNKFDFIICSELLEHLKKDSKALSEIRRVLKPNGILVVTVPLINFPFLWDPVNWLLMRLFKTHINKDIWWLAGIWADHEKLYNKQELLKVVERQKFVIRKTQHVIHYCLPFSHFILYGIGKNLIEIFGIKSFDRFNLANKKNPSIFAKIFLFPSRFDSSRLLEKSAVNMCVSFEKSSP